MRKREWGQKSNQGYISGKPNSSIENSSTPRLGGGSRNNSNNTGNGHSAGTYSFSSYHQDGIGGGSGGGGVGIGNVQNDLFSSDGYEYFRHDNDPSCCTCLPDEHASKLRSLLLDPFSNCFDIEQEEAGEYTGSTVEESSSPLHSSTASKFSSITQVRLSSFSFSLFLHLSSLLFSLSLSLSLSLSHTVCLSLCPSPFISSSPPSFLFTLYFFLSPFLSLLSLFLPLPFLSLAPLPSSTHPIPPPN